MCWCMWVHRQAIQLHFHSSTAGIYLIALTGKKLSHSPLYHQDPFVEQQMGASGLILSHFQTYIVDESVSKLVIYNLHFIILLSLCSWVSSVKLPWVVYGDVPCFHFLMISVVWPDR